jgi:membrane protein YqaA with SNARE-associated domain
MGQYLVLAGLILGINLLPAFAPPTWAILAFYKINTDLDTVVIIMIGVIAAASGRYILARATRLIRHKLKKQYVENLESIRSHLSRSSRGWILYFLFFVISPLPSAQVFEAAGLMDAQLIPIAIAFAFGRGISYTVSVLSASTLKEHAMSKLVLDTIKSPWAIALQLVCILGIYFLLKVDWSKRLPK